MRVNLALLAIQIGSMFAVFAVVLFAAAGTIAWPAGWLFLGLFFGFVVALSLWLLRADPALLRERMRGFSGMEHGWDKALIAVMQALFIGWLIVMPLDAVRFGWSQVPGWLQITGGVMLLGSFWLFFLTFRENTYLSAVVRVQEERRQRVISTGPYAYVRHPMYAAAVVMLIGASLLLGSWFGLLAGALLTAGIGRRAVLEERTLRADLEGYDAYTRRVRYRLLPGVW